MKTDPHEQRIREHMAPGALSAEGFLGTDRRPLGEIIDTDRSTLVGLNVTGEQLASRLQEILLAAMADLGRAVEVLPGLTACYQDAMGPIPCPWGGCGVFAKGEAVLVQGETGREVRFTPLSVHLIARHGFFQGLGSPYRLDPVELVDLLGLGRPR